MLPVLLLAARVLLVHDDPEPMEVLAASLRAAGLEARLEDQAAFRAHGDTPRPAAVFMYVHGAFDAEVERRLIAYTEQGGRLIVVHHGAASGKMSAARWMPFLGLRILPRNAPEFGWNVARGDAQLVNLNPRHPVTSEGVRYDRTVAYTPSDAPSAPQQLPAIDLPNTEVFLNQLFTDGREKTVLFGVKIGTQMQDRGGWLKPAGKGWIFYFQSGHQAADFRHPAFARILLNAVRWRSVLP